MVDYRNWVIWIWDSDDKKHIEFTKHANLEDVIRFCQMRGFTKYCIFDDKLIHVATDGNKVLLGLG